MLLEQKSRRKLLTKRCLAMFMVIVVAVSFCGITAFADDETTTETEYEDPERWGWPLDGIYDSVKDTMSTLLIKHI